MPVRFPTTGLISGVEIDNFEVEIYQPDARDPKRSSKAARNGRAYGDDWDEENNEAPRNRTEFHLYHHDHLDIDEEEGADFKVLMLPITVGPRENITMWVKN